MNKIHKAEWLLNIQLHKLFLNSKEILNHFFAVNKIVFQNVNGLNPLTTHSTC